MSNRFQYGGQAVIEGVMMRGRRFLAVAVRKPNQEIIVDRRPIGGLTTKFSFLKWPLIRGVVTLVESLVMGMKALMFSANQMAEGEDEELSPMELSLTLAMALGLFILLFIVAPNLVATWIQSLIPDRVILANLVEGVLRIVIFLLYIVGISRIRDIQRVFQYHGAEHKVIHTYESGKNLTVSNAREYSPLHPRCGTSFLLVVMVISVIFFTLLGKQSLLMRVGTRILLLPIVAGVSYEVIKLTANDRFSKYLRWLSYPGLLLQKLTTKEPDDSQIEVAIEALNSVVESDNENVISVS